MHHYCVQLSDKILNMLKADTILKNALRVEQGLGIVSYARMCEETQSRWF